MESVGLRMSERTPAVAGSMAAHGLIGLVYLVVVDLVLLRWSCSVLVLGERDAIARWPKWGRIV